MKSYRLTHVQKMRQGRAFKIAVRGDLAPVRRVSGKVAH